MNAFVEACKVEARAMEDLIPFIRDRSFEGQLVVTDKGNLSEFLQKTIGDVAFNAKDRRIWSIEIKSEAENKYGNFFLETWSNLSRFTVGWMFTTKADLLFYYFVKEKMLYVVSFLKLKEWAFQKRRIWSFEEKGQSKYQQKNDTWGRCVPISTIEREVGASKYFFGAEEGCEVQDEEEFLFGATA